MRELRVPGCLGDGAVKGEILVDRALAALQRRIDRAKRPRDPAACSGGAAAGGEPGRLDLDAGPQFHDFEDVADRGQSVERQAEGAAPDIGRDEGAGALARHDEPLRAQCRDRFADHRAADPHRGHHLLLGRQFGAGPQFGAGDLTCDPLGDLARQVARRQHRPQHQAGIAPLGHGFRLDIHRVII